MKSRKNLIEQLKPLPHFTKSTVYQFGEHMGLTDSTIDTYISRFLKSKEIIRFKRGFYVTSDFFNKNKDDVSYSFYLANLVRTPSYVSSWAALQYYNFATEAIHSVTSMTTKVTENYEIKAGNFSYQSIDKRLFNDFNLVKGKFDFFIASPSKALFDLLYFKTHQFRGITEKEIKPLIEELRIDFDEMDKEEQTKFYSLIKKYLHE